MPVTLFEIETPDGTSSAFGATYAVNEERERPFAVAMRKERNAVESGKSNDAPEDAAVNVAISIPAAFAGNACTVADAAASVPEYRNSIRSTGPAYSGERYSPFDTVHPAGGSTPVKSAICVVGPAATANRNAKAAPKLSDAFDAYYTMFLAARRKKRAPFFAATRNHPLTNSQLPFYISLKDNPLK